MILRYLAFQVGTVSSPQTVPDKARPRLKFDRSPTQALIYGGSQKFVALFGGVLMIRSSLFVGVYRRALDFLKLPIGSMLSGLTAMPTVAPVVLGTFVNQCLPAELHAWNLDAQLTC